MYLLRICTLCGIGDHLNDGVPGGVGCVQAVVYGPSRSLYHGAMRGHHGPTIHGHGHSLGGGRTTHLGQVIAEENYLRHG